MNDNENLIYGIHPVLEAMSSANTRVEKIYLREGIRSKSISEIIDKASSKRVPVSNVPGKKLYEMVGKVNDQGVVAQLSFADYIEFEDWLESVDTSDNPFVIILDEIEDVHNFGAILRSAAAADAAGVIVPKHRQAPINATVFKTSAGTAGKVPVIRVTNINQTIASLKDAGFWTAALDDSGTQTIWDVDYNSPMAFIVGSEGPGVRKKTLENSDFILQIPMKNNVESLNASVSAALLMFEVQRRRHGI